MSFGLGSRPRLTASQLIANLHSPVSVPCPLCVRQARLERAFLCAPELRARKSPSAALSGSLTLFVLGRVAGEYSAKKCPLFRRASLEQLGSALMRYWVQSRRWLAGAQAVPNGSAHSAVQGVRIVPQVARYGLPSHSEVLAQFVG